LINAQRKNLDGKGSYVTKKVKPILDKLVGKDSFSVEHYRNFVSDPSINNTHNFWASAEALSRPKGQFEVASSAVLNELKTLKRAKGYKRPESRKAIDSIVSNKSLSDTDKVEALLSKGLVDSSKKYTVPKWSSGAADPATDVLSRPLKAIFQKHKNTQTKLKEFESGLTEGKSIMDMATKGTEAQKEVIRRMALDKATIGAPAKYTKMFAGMGASTGAVGTGLVLDGSRAKK
jgi:hypothetical protein